MTKKADLAVVIGRFQPVHNAHIQMIKAALDVAHDVLVIIGSANEPRSYKDPFLADERIAMIADTINDKSHVWFACVENSMYSDTEWAARVQQEVYHFHGGGSENIVLVGHSKDESSFYLKMFPQWDFVDVGKFEPLNATDIRSLFFKKDWNPKFISGVVPPGVLNFLETFSQSEEYQMILAEREHIENYKKQFSSLPYPVTFVTADAVVFCAGHVLLVERGALPGKGLLALPGGFLDANSDKSMLDAAIRELKEETGIKLPVPVLRGSVTGSRVFDAIGRSARGRTITHAFCFHVDTPIPKVRGSDDAAKAFWVPVGELNRGCMFEDHYEIIRHFVNAG